MEILVAILVIVVIAAVAFAIMQRRSGARGLRRPGDSRIAGRDRVPPNDPMAAAVAEQMRATDPHEMAVAEQRLQATARQVAAPMVTEAARAEHQRGGAYAADPDGADPADQDYPASPPAYGDPHVDDTIEPATGAHTNGHRDPEIDPRYSDRRR